MPVSGAPDFNAKLTNDRSISVVDPGENAERVNGVGGSLYRSGHWVFADGFESGKLLGHWSTQVSGTGVVVLEDGTGGQGTVWNGMYSAKLLTDGVSGHFANIIKDHPVYPTRMGWEAMWKPSVNGNIINQDVIFVMIWNRATDLFPVTIPGAACSLKAYVKISSDGSGNLSLSLMEDNGGTGAYVVEVASLPIKSSSGTIWHSLKYVADFQTGNYGKLYVDWLQYDFSSKILARGNPAVALQGMWMSTGISVVANDNNPHQLNLDDVIFTADEP